MKKILYVTTSLLRNESAAIRNVSLIKGLKENGYIVDAVTLEFEKKYEDNFLKNELGLNMKIVKLKVDRFNKIHSSLRSVEKSTMKKNSFFNKIIFSLKDIAKQFIFFPDVFCESIKEASDIKIQDGDYDFIISSSDYKSSHFIAEKIIEKNSLKIPWIQIWGDPWSNDVGLKKVNSLVKRRIQRNEKRLLEKATSIFYISELTAKDMVKKFPRMKGKINYLFRSYMKEIITDIGNKDKEKYIFAYTGTVKNRNLLPLIIEVEKYNQKNRIPIELQFYGVEGNSMAQFKDKEFLKIYDRVAFEKVLDIYRKSDILVYIDNMGNTTQIPGKIYDYFGTDKVILGLYERESSYGYLNKFDRIELFENKDGKINLDIVISKIGSKSPLETFSPKTIAKSFLKNIERSL